MNSGCGKVPASTRDAGTITEDHPWTDRRSICAGVLVLPFEVEHIEQVPNRGHVVLVTSREPYDRLFRELAGEGEEAGPPLRIRRIGDCCQPALIAHAVFAGHQAARELDDPESSAPDRDRSVIQSH
jgi:hypothetical protein